MADQEAGTSLFPRTKELEADLDALYERKNTLSPEQLNAEILALKDKYRPTEKIEKKVQGLGPDLAEIGKAGLKLADVGLSFYGPYKGAKIGIGALGRLGIPALPAAIGGEVAGDMAARAGQSYGLGTREGLGLEEYGSLSLSNPLLTAPLGEGAASTIGLLAGRTPRGAVRQLAQSGPEAPQKQMAATMGFFRGGGTGREIALSEKVGAASVPVARTGFFEGGDKLDLRTMRVTGSSPVETVDDLLRNADSLITDIGGKTRQIAKDLDEAALVVAAQRSSVPLASVKITEKDLEKLREVADSYRSVTFSADVGEGVGSLAAKLADDLSGKELRLQDVENWIEKINNAQRRGGRFDEAAQAAAMSGDLGALARLEAQGLAADEMRAILKAKRKEIVDQIAPFLGSEILPTALRSRLRGVTANTIEDLDSLWGAFRDVEFGLERAAFNAMAGANIQSARSLNRATQGISVLEPINQSAGIPLTRGVQALGLGQPGELEALRQSRLVTERLKQVGRFLAGDPRASRLGGMAGALDRVPELPAVPIAIAVARSTQDVEDNPDSLRHLLQQISLVDPALADAGDKAFKHGSIDEKRLAMAKMSSLRPDLFSPSPVPGFKSIVDGVITNPVEMKAATQKINEAYPRDVLKRNRLKRLILEGQPLSEEALTALGAPPPEGEVMGINKTISRLEGGQRRDAYPPPRPGSGVTVATGVDLGQWSVADLRAAGVSEDLVIRLYPYLGLKDKAAKEKLAQAPLVLSQEDADVLDNLIMGKIRAQLERRYNKETGGSLSDLPEEVQTVALSLAYNMGPNFRAPKTWGALIKGNWQALYRQLMNFGSKDPKLDGRRRAEAEILTPLLAPKEQIALDVTEATKKPPVG